MRRKGNSYRSGGEFGDIGPYVPTSAGPNVEQDFGTKEKLADIDDVLEQARTIGRVGNLFAGVAPPDKPPKPRDEELFLELDEELLANH